MNRQRLAKCYSANEEWKNRKRKWGIIRRVKRVLNKEKNKFAEEMRNNPTTGESVLYSLIKEAGIEFNPQVQVGPFIVDCLIRRKKIKTVVEVDGSSHVGREEYDRDRDEWLWAHFYRVIRFTNDEVIRNPKAIIDRLQSFLREAE